MTNLLLILAIAVGIVMGLSIIMAVIMWFIGSEEPGRDGKPEPTRAVEFERNIPGGKSDDSE